MYSWVPNKRGDPHKQEGGQGGGGRGVTFFFEKKKIIGGGKLNEDPRVSCKLTLIEEMNREIYEAANSRSAEEQQLFGMKYGNI